jgi:hypothetical protein
VPTGAAPATRSPATAGPPHKHSVAPHVLSRSEPPRASAAAKDTSGTGTATAAPGDGPMPGIAATPPRPRAGQGPRATKPPPPEAEHRACRPPPPTQHRAAATPPTAPRLDPGAGSARSRVAPPDARIDHSAEPSGAASSPQRVDSPVNGLCGPRV